MAEAENSTLKEKALAAKEKVAEKAGELKTRSVEAYNQSGEVLRERAKVVDDKVHNSPWPVVDGAFVSGILLGYILGRK